MNNFPQALLYWNMDKNAIDALAVCVCVFLCDEFPDLPVTPLADQYKVDPSLYLQHHLSLFLPSFILLDT